MFNCLFSRVCILWPSCVVSDLWESISCLNDAFIFLKNCSRTSTLAVGLNISPCIILLYCLINNIFHFIKKITVRLLILFLHFLHNKCNLKYLLHTICLGKALEVYKKWTHCVLTSRQPAEKITYLGMEIYYSTQNCFSLCQHQIT